jgi:hypothetical protein
MAMRRRMATMGKITENWGMEAMLVYNRGFTRTTG